MSMLNKTKVLIIAMTICASAFSASAQSARLRKPTHPTASGPGSATVVTATRNTWRGLTPMQSSAEAAAQLVGTTADLSQAQVGGPYKVEGGEVTFSFLTPSLTKIYRAPRSLAGKLFTIYFTPSEHMFRSELKLGAGFHQCVEPMTKGYYYMLNDAGVAYRLRRSDDSVETIIYQPTRAEIRKLAVNTECVF